MYLTKENIVLIIMTNSGHKKYQYRKQVLDIVDDIVGKDPFIVLFIRLCYSGYICQGPYQGMCLKYSCLTYTYINLPFSLREILF